MNVTLSVVVVTYNRSSLLEGALASVRAAASHLPTEWEVEYLIADDCSDEPHKTAIDHLQGVRVVRPLLNSGLGANVNHALESSVGQYVLQIQDDWVMEGGGPALETLIRFMMHEPDVGIVQLTDVAGDAGFSDRFFEGVKFRVFENDLAPWRRPCGVRPYSDCPHLKRREFISDIGSYREGCSMGETENDYKMRVANQSRWRVANPLGVTAWQHYGREVSLNPGGRQSRVSRVTGSLPGGTRYLLPWLRAVRSDLDHAAAMVARRLRG